MTETTVADATYTRVFYRADHKRFAVTIQALRRKALGDADLSAAADQLAQVIAGVFEADNGLAGNEGKHAFDAESWMAATQLPDYEVNPDQEFRQLQEHVRRLRHTMHSNQPKPDDAQEIIDSLMTGIVAALLPLEAFDAEKFATSASVRPAAYGYTDDSDDDEDEDYEDDDE